MEVENKASLCHYRVVLRVPGYRTRCCTREFPARALLRYKYANFMSSSRPYSVSQACYAQELSESHVPSAHQPQAVHLSPKDLPLVRPGRRRAGRRCIVVFVRVNVLRRLHLYVVVLVAVVALVSTAVLIVVVVAVIASRRGWARRGLVVGVVVVVRGVCWRCSVGQLACPASASVRVSTKLSSSSLRQTAV